MRSSSTSIPATSRPRCRPWPRLDLGISDAELVRRYEAGQSIRQLAVSLGTRYSVVHYRLKAEGAQLRQANGQPHRSATTTRKGPSPSAPAHPRT